MNCQDQSGEWPQLTNTQKVVVRLGLITALAVVSVATAGTGTVLACAAMGALEGTATGAASGTLISGGITYLTTVDIQATKKAAIDGTADGFMCGAIEGAFTGGMNSPHCFVAGTLVCTVDGEVPIEDIEVGDYVLAENPETGELRYSDTLVDDEGNKLHLDKKSNEHLDEPVTVYNFVVDDYHTYFVGENDVLVHNMCQLQPVNNSVDANKLNHIFGKAEHNLDEFVHFFNGNQEQAYSALLKETVKYIKANNISGMFQNITLNVNGFNITVRGNVVDGVVKIGTAFIEKLAR